MRFVQTLWMAAAAVLFADLAAGATPTYSSDVAPILMKNCVTCHRPGQIGPMSLLSYDEVRPWAKSIAQNVAHRRMPPWHADPGYGPFTNERRLTDDQIAAIVQWSEQGAPEGKRGDAPKPPKFDDEGWRLGEPDYIVEFEDVRVPGDGPDQFHDLKKGITLPEDKWLTAIEILPGDRTVVHHVILWQDAKFQDGSWLGAWGAGADPVEFYKGTGRLLKKGATLIGDMHYHPSGTPAIDRTRIGLHFARSASAIKAELKNHWVANMMFAIPPNAPNYQVHSTHTFSDPVKLISLAPHMHYRGKNFTYNLTYPDGRTETLLKVGRYDFNWQTDYIFEEPVSLPAGSTIDCIAHFDNSPENPVNPDPNRTVTFGNESYDEMMIGFVDYVIDDGTPLPAAGAGGGGSGGGGGAKFVVMGLSIAVLGGLAYGLIRLITGG